MRIVLATWGKFHYFHIARHLQQHGLLEAIFSTYPWFKLKREGLPRDKVLSDPWLHSAHMVLNRHGIRLPPLQRGYHRHFQRFIRRNLPECDLFSAMSSAGLSGGMLVKQRGGRYVCERGSAHIQWQERILRQEHERFGLAWQNFPPWVVELERQEYELADRIVVQSQFARQSFIEMGVPEDKLRCLPLGVDLSHFSKTGEPPKDEFVILFVGQVSLQKGFHHLLEAFDRFRHPGKRLIAIGRIQPEMRPFLARYQDRPIEYRGHVPHAELKHVMSQSHVLALPSVQDGFGMVMAEAMACGCPVIASTHTGAADLFTDGREGFIIPVGDSAALSDCLYRLADDSQLRDVMGAAASYRVRALGGWAQHGAACVALYRELTGL